MISKLNSNGASSSMSLDGYIRMTFEALSGLHFSHRQSWEDSNLCEDLSIDGIQAYCAGYCELETGDTQGVSIGWSWYESADGRRFIAPGGISSNVMLVTSGRYDIGPAKTSELLLAWISDERWKDASVGGSKES